MNSMSLIDESVNVERKRNESYECFNLEAEILKSRNAHNDLLKRITSANVVPPKKTTSHSVETQKPELKVYSRKPKNVKNVGSSKKAKIVESKNANHSEPNHTWGSNASYIPSSSYHVMIVPVAAAPRAVDLADSPVSTSIDQDDLSTIISSTHDQEHSLIISQANKPKDNTLRGSVPDQDEASRLGFNHPMRNDIGYGAFDFHQRSSSNKVSKTRIHGCNDGIDIHARTHPHSSRSQVIGSAWLRLERKGMVRVPFRSGVVIVIPFRRMVSLE
nr:hypothetical protein [Tanacetum cinerariifolium]